MSERRNPNDTETEVILANFGVVKFSFPPLDLREQILPGLEREIAWLREHMEEGSLDENCLSQSAHTVYIDTRPCPPFLQPYEHDEHLLGKIIAHLRKRDKIAQKINNWDENESGLTLPNDSRFGISVDEIKNIIIPGNLSL